MVEGSQGPPASADKKKGRQLPGKRNNSICIYVVDTSRQGQGYMYACTVGGRASTIVAVTSVEAALGTDVEVAAGTSAENEAVATDAGNKG